MNLAVDTLYGSLYVPSLEGIVAVMNGTTDTVLKDVEIGTTGPSYTAYDSSNGNVYVANLDATSVDPPGPYDVTVISTDSNEVVGNVVVGAGSDGLAFDSSNGYLYVAGGNVTAINGATDQVVGWAPVGCGPGGIAYDSAAAGLYVANFCSDNVTVVPITDSPVLDSVVVWGPGPLNTGADVFLFATPSCVFGPCPAGTTYQWSLNNTLASLNASTGSQVGITAGSVPGFVMLFANGTLNGETIQSGPVKITIIPGLAVVAVTPPTVRLSYDAAYVFTVASSCTGGSAPVW